MPREDPHRLQHLLDGETLADQLEHAVGATLDADQHLNAARLLQAPREVVVDLVDADLDVERNADHADDLIAQSGSMKKSSSKNLMASTPCSRLRYSTSSMTASADQPRQRPRLKRSL